MVKLLHWCALRTSDFAIWLHDKAGGLECWCDEKHWAKLAKRVAKQHPVKGEAIKAWLAVPVPPLDYTFDPNKPIITMLDEWEDK